METSMAIKAIVCDIEGTTTSISFVKDTLFPFALKHVESFLRGNWESESVIKAISALRKQSIEDLGAKIEGAVAIAEGDKDLDTQIVSVVENVKWQMSNDRKTTPLKTIQGLIWEQGYKNGEIKGHVYPDVPKAFDTWTNAGIKIYIYSSGSVHAQKLIFGNSDSGDLLSKISGHFDTEIGMKQDKDSYVKIIKDINIPANEICFLTDIVKEAKAAKDAGMNVIILERPGNAELSNEERTEYKVVDSFEVISLEEIPIAKRKIEEVSAVEEPPSKLRKVEENAADNCNNETENKIEASKTATEETDSKMDKADLTTNIANEINETKKLETEVTKMDVDNEEDVKEEIKDKLGNAIDDVKNDKTETTNSDENKKTAENVDSTIDKNSIPEKAMEIDESEMTEKDAKTENDNEKIENATKNIENEKKSEIETITDNGAVEVTKSVKENDVNKIESEETPKVIVENGKDDSTKSTSEPETKDMTQDKDKKEENGVAADKEENSTLVVSVDEVSADKKVCKAIDQDNKNASNVASENLINGKTQTVGEALDTQSDIKNLSAENKNEKIESNKDVSKIENSSDNPKIENSTDNSKLTNSSDNSNVSCIETAEVSKCDEKIEVEKTEKIDEEMKELKEESKSPVVTAAKISSADEEKMEIDGKMSTESNNSLPIVNGSKKDIEMNEDENKMETNVPPQTDPLPESSLITKTNESETTKNEIEKENVSSDKKADTEQLKSTTDSSSIPVPIVRCSSSPDSQTTDSKTIQKTEISQIVEKTSPDSKEKKSRVEITIEETDSQFGLTTQTTTHIVKEISITEQTHGSPSKIDAETVELLEKVAGKDSAKIRGQSPSKIDGEIVTEIEQKNATNSDECKNGESVDVESAAKNNQSISDAPSQTNGKAIDVCLHKNDNDSDKENEETLTEKTTDISANGDADKDSSVCDKGLVVKKCPDLLVKSPASAAAVAATPSVTIAEIES